MKATSSLTVLVSALLLLFSCGVTVGADYAQDINSQNGGKGYGYIAGQYYTNMKIFVSEDSELDLSAYSEKVATDTTFLTFCVNRYVKDVYRAQSYGSLSNTQYNTTTNARNDSLSLGGAALYAWYATGNLEGYNYNSPGNSGSLLQYDLWGMVGQWKLSWDTDQFLASLLNINSDKNYWMQAYDTSEYYDFIGDYTVYVSSNYLEDGVTRNQDFLYLAKKPEAISEETSSSTPEPATALILGSLSIIGLPIAARIRKNRSKSFRK
ncbi:MAG: hypothetical protein ACRC2T_18685 [Thermoguttaceae bacterium]